MSRRCPGRDPRVVDPGVNLSTPVAGSGRPEPFDREVRGWLVTATDVDVHADAHPARHRQSVRAIRRGARLRPDDAVPLPGGGVTRHSDAGAHPRRFGGRQLKVRRIE
ncbi:hypothetical protein GCM10025734_14360 [Kitasatospora paranensis]